MPGSWNVLPETTSQCTRVDASVKAARTLSKYKDSFPDVEISIHDDVIKWKHFLRYRPFVRGIHRSTVNSLRKGQWRGALMFSLIGAWTKSWVNNRHAGDLRRHRAHYGVTVIYKDKTLVRPSYIYIANPYIGKTLSLYWDGPRVTCLIHNCFCFFFHLGSHLINIRLLFIVIMDPSTMMLVLISRDLPLWRSRTQPVIVEVAIA